MAMPCKCKCQQRVEQLNPTSCQQLGIALVNITVQKDWPCSSKYNRSVSPVLSSHQKLGHLTAAADAFLQDLMRSVNGTKNSTELRFYRWVHHTFVSSRNGILYIHPRFCTTSVVRNMGLRGGRIDGNVCVNPRFHMDSVICNQGLTQELLAAVVGVFLCHVTSRRRKRLLHLADLHAPFACLLPILSLRNLRSCSRL